MGPTEDDLTKQAISASLGLSLEFDEIVAEYVKAYLQQRNLTNHPFPSALCMMPKGSRMLQNDHGTAPGVVLDIEGKMVVMFPGPPRELIPMYTNYLKPELIDKNHKMFFEKCYMTSGVGESSLEKALREKAIENDRYRINTYLTESGVMVKAIGQGTSEEDALRKVMQNDQSVKEIIGPFLYSEIKEEIWQSVGRKLKETSITLSAAESCTGGLFSSYLTRVSGISSVFRGGVVAYDNQIKERILGVSNATLGQYGAVSKQTAEEMANGIAEYFESDCGIGITGIAGPDGGSEDKPVGLVYVCVKFKGEIVTRENIFRGSREMIQKRSALCAFQMLNEFLNKY